MGTLTLFAITIILPLSLARASDCDTLSQRIMYDSSYRMCSLLQTGDIDTNAIINPGLVVPQYSFEYQSDSTTFRMHVTEFRKNGSWILLENFCANKSYNWSPASNSDTDEVTNAQLTALSRTVNFDIDTGDTLSLFRLTMLEDIQGDSVTFVEAHFPVPASASIELIDSATGDRLHLFDSLRVSSTNGQQCLYLQRPAVARSVLVVPSSIGQKTAFIRVNVKSDSTPMHWYRSDVISTAGSNVLLAAMAGYSSAYENGNACQSSSCPLAFTSLPNGTGVRLSVSPTNGVSAINIYKASGILQTTVSTGGQSGPFDVSLSPGLYFLVAMSGTAHVCTRSGYVQP